MPSKLFYRLVVISLSLCIAACSDSNTPAGNDPGTPPSPFTEADRWIYAYMEKNYLWNEPLPHLDPDFTKEPKVFLWTLLEGVASFDNLNHDDGHWTDGKRDYYYSGIEVRDDDGSSRSLRAPTEGSGIMYLRRAMLGQDRQQGLAVMTVAPGTEAAKAGLRRSDFIYEVGGKPVSEIGYDAALEAVYAGDVSITVANFDRSGSRPALTNRRTLRLGRSTFTDPAIYFSTVIDSYPGHRIGYIHYNVFDSDFDNQLIGIFADFKARGITDLILDLRYNGGGHVSAAAVMATLIAGAPHFDEVIVETRFNAARRAAGETGFYRIGNPAVPEGNHNHTPMRTALTAATPLTEVYVLTSASTASASELLINGLRGIGVKVHTVGTATNGKNCGMETVSRSYGGSLYILRPITFYCLNAAGSCDYADGIAADIPIDDTSVYPGEFASIYDLLSAAAISHIIGQSRASTAVTPDGLLLPSADMPQGYRCGAVIEPCEE